MKTTLIALAALATLTAPNAHALYKVVGPDGRVAYTDRPPVDNSRVTQVTAGSSHGSADGEVTLPYEVRQAMQRNPVTIFTAENCDPCRVGRDLLARRGIPFEEKTLVTAEDKAAMKQSVGGVGLPSLKVGTQQINGYEAGQWNGALDAAGYPSSSKLPSNFRQAEATTAAPRAAPKPPAAKAPPPPRDPVAAPPATGGIRF